MAPIRHPTTRQSMHLLLRRLSVLRVFPGASRRNPRPARWHRYLPDLSRTTGDRCGPGAPRVHAAARRIQDRALVCKLLPDADREYASRSWHSVRRRDPQLHRCNRIITGCSARPHPRERLSSICSGRSGAASPAATHGADLAPGMRGPCSTTSTRSAALAVQRSEREVEGCSASAQSRRASRGRSHPGRSPPLECPDRARRTPKRGSESHPASAITAGPGSRKPGDLGRDPADPVSRRRTRGCSARLPWATAVDS